MKKWVNVDWDEIEPGDEISRIGCVRDSFTVDQIGSMFCLSASSHFSRRYTNKGTQFQYQRYEEVEVPDGWYLCEFLTFGTIVRYKKGNYMYEGEGPRLSKTGLVEDYKILQKCYFKPLSED